LRVLGQLQLLLRTFVAKPGEGEAEHLVGLLEDPFGLRIDFGQLLAHTWIL
jgi:hypothetical protein